MRYLLLLLLPLWLWAGESRLLLPGVSVHEDHENQFGEAYNGVNPGIGYEINDFRRYEQSYFTANVMLFSDSFSHPQLTVGFGHAIRFEGRYMDTAIGLAGFVGLKKLYESDDRTGRTGKYGLMGGVAPVVAFYRGDWSLNLLYVPSVEVGDYDLTGFAFAYLGWKF